MGRCGFFDFDGDNTIWIIIVIGIILLLIFSANDRC